jgi:thioredoxin 1
MASTELTSTNHQELLATQGVIVVDAWASWCGPCRAFAPIFEAAAQRHPGVVWAKLDTQREPELAGAFGIRAIPTLLVLRDGILLLQQAGMLPARALDELVQKAQALDMDAVRQALNEREGRLESERPAAATK